nr:28S ribosomal protein S15, mitochondrial [Leptinotarsa decemlineata]
MNSNVIIFNNNLKTYCNIIFARHYAFKSDLKIKWVRPKKVPCYKPEKSGDLLGIPNIENKKNILGFNDSKELQSADETVKKLFTLEFAPKKYSNRTYFKEIVHSVKRHEFDLGSAEVKIAQWTGIIRALQSVMERFPRNVKLKVNLKELIDQRNKHLKYLRCWDYKKFEWLLETLNIQYKPHPNKFHWITRKESLQKLTDKYCEDVKQNLLNNYRLELESQQLNFLEEKVATLNFIKEKQNQFDHSIDEINEELDDVKKQLEQLKQGRT